jgi:hypothetical protein|tara:strand:+ start:7099 stop:7386 length:288 start_codon:yes stop_codon:yes gene_type:complete
MKSDVKALRVTGTGAVFTGRTRLRGIILNSTEAAGGTDGAIKLYDGQATPQLQFEVSVQAGDDFTLNLPEDGVLFKDGLYTSVLTACLATVLIDK